MKKKKTLTILMSNYNLIDCGHRTFDLPFIILLVIVIILVLSKIFWLQLIVSEKHHIVE